MFLREMNKSFNFYRAEQIYEQFYRLFTRSDTEANPSIYAGVLARAYIDASFLPDIYKFLNTLYLKQNKSTTHPPEFWEPLIEATHLVLRNELIAIDSKIKLAAAVGDEKADLFATAIMAILLSGESPNKEVIFSRTFAGLDQSFTLNVRANRYLTKKVDWLEMKVATPVRKMAFNLTIAALILGGVGHLADSQDIITITNEVSEVTFLTWATLFFGSVPAIAISRTIDATANLVASTVDRDRRGQLSQLMDMPMNELQRACDKLLAQINEKK